MFESTLNIVQFVSTRRRAVTSPMGSFTPYPPFSLDIPDSRDIPGSSQTPPVITCFLRYHRSSSVIRDSFGYHAFPQLLETPLATICFLRCYRPPQLLETPLAITCFLQMSQIFLVIRGSLSYHAFLQMS